MLTILLFDGLTALILAGIPALFIWLFRRTKPYGTPGWQPLLMAVLTVVWGAVFYGSFIEPRFLTVKRYPVRLGPGNEHLRLAVISDIHLGGYRDARWLEKVVAKVNEQQPDAIIVDGDIVTTATGLGELAPLKELKSRYGNYAALGNWDYRVGAVDTRQQVEAFGVEVLTNENVAVGEGSRPVRFIGLDDDTFGTPDWNQAAANLPSGALKIVVAHNPDFVSEAEVRGMDLTIAGHTHCGQIRLPFIGPVPPLPTHIGRRFDCGMFAYGQTALFITPGVGEFGPRARFFNPPEVSVVEVVY